jgi:hypothetical protein
LVTICTRCLALAVLGVAIACTSRAAVTGTYDLHSVNGQSLPVRASAHSQGSAEIVGGSITLNTNVTYQNRLLFRVRYDTLTYADSAVHAGRYMTKGAAIRLDTPSGSMHGKLSDGSLTIDLEGWQYGYRIR